MIPILWWEPNLGSMENIWIVTIFLSLKATPLFAVIETQKLKGAEFYTSQALTTCNAEETGDRL